MSYIYSLLKKTEVSAGSTKYLPVQTFSGDFYHLFYPVNEAIVHFLWPLVLGDQQVFRNIKINQIPITRDFYFVLAARVYDLPKDTIIWVRQARFIKNYVDEPPGCQSFLT